MRSSSCSCRTAPRCRAPTRWSSRRREIIQKTPGVDNAVAFAGFSGATFTNATNAGVIFARVQAVRGAAASTASRPTRSSATLFGSLQSIQEAFIIALPPPPIRGIGNAGGFKMQIQERDSADMRPILALAYEMMGKANQTPGLTGVFTTFSASSPQFFLAIDRDKARMLNVPIPNIFETLSINLGTVLCQRLQRLRPRLPGARAGRPGVPPRARRHLEAEGALGDRRAGAARHAGRDPRRRPARRWCSATTCMSRCRCRATPRPASRPARRSTLMERHRRQDAAARHVLSNGPSSPTRSARPATPPSSSSGCRCCSCSWRWRRSMKAGCCRSRSC